MARSAHSCGEPGLVKSGRSHRALLPFGGDYLDHFASAYLGERSTANSRHDDLVAQPFDFAGVTRRPVGRQAASRRSAGGRARRRPGASRLPVFAGRELPSRTCVRLLASRIDTSSQRARPGEGACRHATAAHGRCAYPGGGDARSVRPLTQIIVNFEAGRGKGGFSVCKKTSVVSRCSRDISALRRWTSGPPKGPKTTRYTDIT